MVFQNPGVTTRTATTGIAELPELSLLWAESLGDSRVCVAVLDGLVDQSHPSFEGAQLTRLQTLVSGTVSSGLMSLHGTHVTSVIFGQHQSAVRGIAPNCRGLIIPVFSDNRKGSLSQLDLARAINQAVEQGANIINISGGQLSKSGEADQMLANAVRFCNDEGVLIVAAAGNDACQCLHVPAALPSVLAVGAMNAQGLPFDFSNWGETYQTQGILAPGENILGAIPGGGTALKSGTSFATPIVSGIVALLLSIQLKRGEKPNPFAIREALLKSALPCKPEIASDCRRFLAGSLNIPRAYTLITEGEVSDVSEQQPVEATLQPSEACPIDLKTSQADSQMATVGVQAASLLSGEPSPAPIQNSGNTMTLNTNNMTSSAVTPSNVVPSEGCGCDTSPKSLIYALGTLNYDFGTEARRDSFRQLMPDPYEVPNPDNPNQPFRFPANPFDASQMVSYLGAEKYEMTRLIWTLNIELTPVYAIEPIGPYANEVYERLLLALEDQIRPANDDKFVERISIPGYLSGKSVTLFSGQVVPVVVPQVRGMYSWNVNALIDAAIEASTPTPQQTETPAQAAERAERLRDGLREFLNRVYFDLRNLGQTSQERALNYAATNAFQSAAAFSKAVARSLLLDTISVERSPFCRMDSDCWDVRLTFFDPENNQRAKRVFRFTVDVSDVMPVSIGDVRSWSIS